MYKKLKCAEWSFDRHDIFNGLSFSVSNMVKREENNSSDETMAVSSGLESLYTLLDVSALITYSESFKN